MNVNIKTHTHKHAYIHGINETTLTHTHTYTYIHMTYNQATWANIQKTKPISYSDWRTWLANVAQIEFLMALNDTATQFMP